MDPRRRKTIDALIGAAEQLFSERAADEVTVEELAEHAGVAVGSIYNHFGSKAGLYAATLDRALDADEAYMNRAFSPERSPIEQLVAAGHEHLQFYIDHPALFRMLAFPPEPGHYAASTDVADAIGKRIDQQLERIADAIERGIATGQVAPIDPRATATIMWAAANGIISLAWRSDKQRRSVDEVRALLDTLDMYLAGALVRGDR